MAGVSKYARKVDGNQRDIVSALLTIGVQVRDMSRAGCGMPDLICFWRGDTYLIEIKNGDRPPSARKLTAEQLWFHSAAKAGGVTIHVVNDVTEALAIFGAK